MASIDFSSIPAPAIIEELDYETILAAMIADLQSRDPSYSEILESDPGVKILEVAAARELILRQRINDALKATLLRYAAGGDLDNLSAFYGVTRLQGETDDELRERTIERVMGSSTAGGRSWYRFQALTASPLIADVDVDSPFPGQVRVSVLSKEGNGTASPALLAAVDAVVQSDAVRVITDTVTTVTAQVVTVNIQAQVWLLPETPATVFDTLEQTLRTAFTAESGLGWDVTLSWLIAKLQQPGVQRVMLQVPTARVICDANMAAALGTVSLTLMGRDR
jgi:phage-related baseplate assembly protein